MKLFGYSIKKEKEKRAALPYTVNTLGELSISDVSDIYTDSKALKLSAVYRAVNVISDAVASMPIDVYYYEGDWKKKEYSNLYKLLNISPNKSQNAFNFKKQLIVYLKLKGNAYIWIDRNIKNEIKNLYLIEPSRVTISVGDDGTLNYAIDGEIVNSDNIIHIKNVSIDGIRGLSTLEYARNVLATDYYSDEYNKNFFEGGANLRGILTPKDGVYLDETQATEAKNSFVSQINPISGGKSGSVVVLSHNLDYKPITLSPKDAMLLESKEFNLLSIAQFFGVPLSKLLYTKTNKYNTIEAEQLDFLNSTILPLIEQIEVELFRKLFLPSEYDSRELKFDVSNLLRLDANTQADIYVKYINTGVMSINEVRDKLDMAYPVPNGNRHYIQQNLQPLDNLTNDIKNSKND